VPRDERRREVVVDLEIAFELRGDLLAEAGVRVQAGHLVFVLVGHQPEQRFGDRLGQGRLAHRQLGHPHPLDHVLVALAYAAFW
jgi:hypothetical protein